MYRVEPIPSALARETVEREHYLHRKPPVSNAFGLCSESGSLVGVVTYGTPASRATQVSACPTDPGRVIELNRLWVADAEPRNTESWFVSRSLKLLPGALVVVSYADTAYGHEGYIYRALNFRFAGSTHARRKLYDYVIPGSNQHSRHVPWGAPGSVKVERSPKNRYWVVTGNRAERRVTEALVMWPSLSWSA